jgi:short-subunit dehydrogenase
MLEKEQPIIAFLINNAGIGEKLGPYIELPIEKVNEIIQVNCITVATLCTICIPYMQEGSRILNISSQSSFQPVPYINLYAATKVFVRSFTRALNVELKESGISATAVCPGWVDTEMLPRIINGKTIKYQGLVAPKLVALKAFSDAKKKKDMSVCTLYVKYMHLLAKIFPQKTVMKTWVRSISKFIEK